MQGVLTGAAVLLALYCLAVGALFLFQRRILFRPDTGLPDLARAGIHDAREMTVTTGDGHSLRSWYVPHESPDAAVVLYLHGNAGHIGHRAYRLAIYRRAGWGVLMLGYRGYGGNSGRPSEPGLLADARAGLAALLAMGIPPERIVLWGESLGSGPAARLATEQKVACVVLEAPYTSIPDMAAMRYPFVPVRWLVRDRFDTARVIGGVRSPVLVIHGARDRIIPLAMGQAVFAAAPEPKRLWIAPEAGHIDLVEAGAIEAAAEYVSAITASAPANP